MGCTDSAPNDGANTGDDVSLITLDGGNSPASAGLALTIPDDALADSNVSLTIEALSTLPRGAVRAWELGPDGTQFSKPVVLEADYGNFDLPPGVDADSLRLAVYVDHRWVQLADTAHDFDKKVVRATTTHFSTYGLVPDPKEVLGFGSVWEANGVVVSASAPMFGELFVSPTAIGIYLSGGVAGPLALDISGLPTDGDNYLYIDDHDDETLVTPADAGAITITLDGSGQHYIWLQPNPGTLTIGEYAGHVDQCGQVGVRDGNTCTLTSDVEEEFQIVAPNQVLDCDGHRISQAYANRGTGIGILVPGFAQHYVPLKNITIRNCVIGGPDASFSYGIVAHDAVDLRIEGSVFEDSPMGLSILSGSGAVIVSNQFVRTPLEAINFASTGGPANGRLEYNSIEMLADAGLDWGWGIDIYGLAGPLSELTVAENSIVGGTGGIRLGRLGPVSSTDVTGNSLVGSTFAALEYSGPNPTNRIWWNNLESSGYGVFSSGPAEISDGEGRGNWWGHDCPEALFVAGVDSNDGAVVDSFPYGRRNGWEIVGLEPGCDVTPPGAPVILSPVYEEGVSYISTPVILGTAEPFAQVKVFEGTTELGADYAMADGNFAVSLVALMSGQHVIHATAVDASGNESTSSAAISFGIQVIDEGNPISGENGKFRIVELSVLPNPFDPVRERNQLRLTLDVDAVNGLGGNSQNHRFFAVTARAVLAPETLETIATIYAASEIERDTDGPVRVTVVDEWDGTNEAGQTLENLKAYPVELSVAVVRLYAGKGTRPYPSLRPGEFLTDEQMSEIMTMMMVGGMFEKRKQLDPNIFVEQRSFVRVDIQGPYTIRHQLEPVVLRGFDPLLDCAAECGNAIEACQKTELDAKYPYESDLRPGACAECGENCVESYLAVSSGVTGAVGRWPMQPSDPHSWDCKYWDSPIKGTTATYLPFGRDRNQALCFGADMAYTKCPFSSSSLNAKNELVCEYSCPWGPETETWPPLTTIPCEPFYVFITYELRDYR